MIENYYTSGPGRYEGQSPMVAFLDCHPELADEGWEGDVESFVAFARFGKWVLQEDQNGFVFGMKARNLVQARKWYDMIGTDWDLIEVRSDV